MHFSLLLIGCIDVLIAAIQGQLQFFAIVKIPRPLDFLRIKNAILLVLQHVDCIPATVRYRIRIWQGIPDGGVVPEKRFLDMHLVNLFLTNTYDAKNKQVEEHFTIDDKHLHGTLWQPPQSEMSMKFSFF